MTAGNDASDAMMKKPVDAYVAQLTKGANTKGVGNQKLAPKVLADGTKEFDLTASVIDWEVSPGKTVKAWAYNGQVPGPWLKVNVGDKVRVVLDNQLPESTAIHFHGLEVPNEMDGVPGLTQPLVKPGGDFTYEFTVKNAGSHMYHSHMNGAEQIPGGLLGVGGRVFADAAPADEDLRLQQEVVRARLALHVIDGIGVLDIGIESKNH